MIEPDIRHHTASALDYVANRLGLSRDPSMQDWEFEVAEPRDLHRYITLFEKTSELPDVRFTLADMIIQAFEDSDRELAADAEWRAFLTSLSLHVNIHAWQIWCWSSWDNELAEAWRVSPFMRRLCEIHFRRGSS